MLLISSFLSPKIEARILKGDAAVFNIRLLNVDNNTFEILKLVSLIFPDIGKFKSIIEFESSKRVIAKEIGNKSSSFISESSSTFFILISFFPYNLEFLILYFRSKFIFPVLIFLEINFSEYTVKSFNAIFLINTEISLYFLKLRIFTYPLTFKYEYF